MFCTCTPMVRLVCHSGMTDVIGYVRVSTEEQAGSGAGLEAQRAAILVEAERRGWRLVEIIQDAVGRSRQWAGSRARR